MKTICVDFDGVIHSYTTKWVTATSIPDPPVGGAIEWINKTRKRYNVVIFSTRAATAHGREAMVRWLMKWGVTPVLGQKLEITSKKPPAVMYIDDRAWLFTGTFPNQQQIESFVPWNRKPKEQPQVKQPGGGSDASKTGPVSGKHPDPVRGTPAAGGSQ